MIKKYLIGTFLLSCMLAYSQDNKGKFMIQGSAGYHNSNALNKYGIQSDKYASRIISGGVNFGYFLSNNFAVGISGSIIYNKYTDIPDPTVNLYKLVNTHSENGAGIFARYNRTLHNSKFGFFLQLSSHYYKVRESIELIESNGTGNLPPVKNVTKGVRIHTSLSPGLIYFINNKFSVESTLGSLYNTYEKLKSPDVSIEKSYTGSGANFSLRQINLGFTYYF